jgi:hypothetical protein
MCEFIKCSYILIRSTNLDKISITSIHCNEDCLLAGWELREKKNRVLCGKHWKKTKREGGIWPSHITSSANFILHDESEAGKQLKMDDCCTVLHKTISLSNDKGIASFVADIRLFHLLLWGNCFRFMQYHLSEHNCRMNWGVPVTVS